MMIIYIWMSVALFGSTQSVTFQLQYSIGGWGTLSSLYKCKVINLVNITTLDEAQVDNITGTHLTGYNNDNVEAFSVGQGQINYFPRDLNKFFKNLRGIEIGNTGLKEIHQSDLKDFPKLVNLYLYNNNLEILEENLFEFNPNLEYLSLGYNKITHIVPNVFDKLIKLKYLSIQLNTCINIIAPNPTAIQSAIATVKSNCTNLDYLSLEQKVKYLENESNLLDSIDLNIEVESLEIEIQNSKFANFFQEQIAGLYAVAFLKEREDVQDTKISNIEEMVANINNGNGTGKNTIILNIS